MVEPNKILVVDDVSENLQVIGKILNEHNYDISFSQDGRHALTILDDIMPDLILLDVAMPIMDGFEVCRQIKQNKKYQLIPIIFLSAKTDEKKIVEGFSIGAADYITKPFKSSELLARVKTHIELKHSRDIILNNNQKLIKLNQMKDKFFSIIAHDLKNPFTSLFLSSELLLRLLRDRNIEKAISRAITIKNTTRSANELLENLLTWSRNQLGDIPFQPVDVSLYDMVESIIKSASTAIFNKSLVVENSIEKNFTLIADNFLLETIIRNLVTNAIKFTHNHGKITIRAMQKKRSIEISVMDTGVGMSIDVLEKLFKVGEKIHSKGTAEESGSGLGLFICKEFVEKHNGKIWVKSEKEKGSEFVFSISNDLSNNFVGERVE